MAQYGIRGRGDHRSTIVLALAIVALLFFTMLCAQAATTVSGNIAIDTTWTAAGSPYIFTVNVAVVSGATLTVQSGTEV